MRIERVWAMPSRFTFRIKPINQLIERWMGQIGGKWVDPFANNSPFNDRCMATNDLDVEARTTHHMESLAFLGEFDSGSINGVLFDPPYSPRQISECYKGLGIRIHAEDTQSSFYGKRKDEIARVVMDDGIVISCGWNSNGMGKSRGFVLEELLLVPHGAGHNDTIVTVERKLGPNL